VEIINKRYRLIELLEQDKILSTYTAVDILQDNQLIKLNLLNSEYTPKPLVDFFAKRFISIKNVTHKQIARNYEFGVVSFIDNRAHSDKIFYFTSEFNEVVDDFEDFIQKLELDEIIERFLELSSLIHTVHLNGFIYGALNPRAIQSVTIGDEVILVLKDLATATLEKFRGHQLEDTYFQSPNVLAGQKASKESDMYSLGVMFLAMIQRTSSLANPKVELEKLKDNLRTYTYHEQLLLQKVLPIIKKLLMPLEEYPYEHVQAMLDELSEAVDKRYITTKIAEYEKLQFHTEIVGRDIEIELILRNMESMMGYKPSKRIFFIQGDNGMGKTRLLQEIEFLITLRKVHVFSSFQLESSGSRNLWVDILQKVISHSDDHVLRKYQAELVKYLPELERKDKTTYMEFLLDGNNKYRLLNRIAAFMNESLQGKTAVFIIDDLHLADTFTMDLINYLSTNVLHQSNLMFILSGEVREDSDNQVYLDSLDLLKKRTDSSVIRLNPLSIEQSGQLIQHILSLSYQPLKLTERIFSRSYGNPLFIQEVLKDLYSRKLLQVSPENGKWSILLSSNDYNSLQVPESIEQALLNQLQDLTYESLDILKTVAVFNKPVSARAICHVLQQVEQIVTLELQDLLLKGILQELVSDNGYLFDFDNKVLKRIVYDAIDTEVKKEMHANIGLYLEENQESKIEELIFHYEGAGNKDKSIQSYLKIAHQLHKQHEIKAEIQYLEKAAVIIEDTIEKTNLYMKIGDLCLEVNLPEKALEYLNRALDLATGENHQENKLAIYLALANLHATLYQAEQVKVYLQKVEEHFPVIHDKGARLEFNRLQAFLLGLENHIDDAEKLLHRIIEESGE